MTVSTAWRDHPIPQVREFFRLVRESGLPLKAVADLAGFDRAVLYSWSHRRHSPSIWALEACLNAIGYRLAVVPSHPQHSHDSGDGIVDAAKSGVRLPSGHVEERSPL